MNNEEALWKEVNALTEELKRIKSGIKHNEITMIIDGNDMCDWGWTTQKTCNEELHRLKNLFKQRIRRDYRF